MKIHCGLGELALGQAGSGGKTVTECDTDGSRHFCPRREGKRKHFKARF